jgi:hypothetical protein
MKFNRLGAFTLGVVITAVSVGAVSFVNAAGDTTLKACANKKTGVMRYIAKGSCNKKTETTLSWNQMGPQGLPGSVGAAGAKGDTGAVGAKGDIGAKGDTGAAGTKGDTGAAGTKGDTGTAGTKGDTGTKGDSGTSGANTNSQIKNICGDNGTTACAIGLKGPGGGIVFATPSTSKNTTGLFYEAAPSTWSSALGDPTSEWCDHQETWESGSGGYGMMDGANRTSLLMDHCLTGAGNLADAYIATVNGVVYGDWFLPSRGELQQMYLHRNVITGFSAAYYWSSTEGGDATAWCLNFSNGVNDADYKYRTYHVRPVRTF